MRIKKLPSPPMPDGEEKVGNTTYKKMSDGSLRREFPRLATRSEKKAAKRRNTRSRLHLHVVKVLEPLGPPLEESPMKDN